MSSVKKPETLEERIFFLGCNAAPLPSDGPINRKLYNLGIEVYHIKRTAIEILKSALEINIKPCYGVVKEDKPIIDEIVEKIRQEREEVVRKLERKEQEIQEKYNRVNEITENPKIKDYPRIISLLKERKRCLGEFQIRIGYKIDYVLTYKPLIYTI